LARIEAAAFRPSIVVIPEPEPIDLPRTEEIRPRRYWFRIISTSEPMIRDIQEVVCAYYKIQLKDLFGYRRDAGLVLARHCGMYLARELTSQTFPMIGRNFKRDHTVAIYAARRIAARLPFDPNLAFDVASITSELEAM
jgi:chromosomal replication initiation ATPase DnaA